MSDELWKVLLEWLCGGIITTLAVLAAWNLAGEWAALLTWIVVGALNNLVWMMRESNREREIWNKKTVQLLASIRSEVQKPPVDHYTPCYLEKVPW
ncbi:MAG TPA: hypothetical protein VFB92_17030 [Vicinamibacterales bacterium]|jgi:hypothetical protein|nr:hypothetical protein [Vicinamibacterales bacterium]